MQRPGIGTLMAVVAVIAAIGIGYSRYTLGTMQRTRLAGLEYLEASRTADTSRYRIIKSGKETDGMYCTIEELSRRGMEGFIDGKPGSPPMHIHPQQTEVFKVKQGLFGWQLGKRNGTAGPGETISIPMGQPHTFWNADPKSDLLMEFTLLPCLQAEDLFKTLCGLGQDYGNLLKVNFFQTMLTFMTGGVRLAEAPAVAWYINKYFVIPAVQHIWGFKPFYPEYTE